MRALLLLFPFLSVHRYTFINAQEQSVRWVELEYSNFVSTIQAYQWTCVLLYDPWDERGSYDHTVVLEGIHDKRRFSSNNNVGFARLSARHHPMLRDEYMSEEEEDVEEPFAKDYYDKGSDTANPMFAMTNETLLDVSLGTPYWPAKLLLLARNYNMYGIVELSHIVGAIPLRIQVLDRWLVQAMQINIENAVPIVQTRANKEIDLFAENQDVDNSFAFEAYERAQQARKEQEKNEEEEGERDLRLLLETDAKADKKRKRGHFTYRKAKVAIVKSTESYLATLGIIVDEYLAWVEGYETTWSEERKAREDDQTNFGFFLNEMNSKILALLDRHLNPDHASRQDLEFQRRMRINREFGKRNKIPNLKKYFQEMVFGSGRSVQRIREVLEEMKSALGATAKERQINRYDFNTSILPIVTNLRDYMTVYSQVDEDDILYSTVVAHLVTDWYNVMREFHINLNKYYLRWLEDHPRPHTNEFQFRTMDVIDMKDPRNYDMLANYDTFHELYTKSGTPVILSNVEMADADLTLEDIVNQCAASIVTSSVHVSHKVGERQGYSGWGGLKEYKLDKELLTDWRRHRPTKFKKKGNKEMKPENFFDIPDDFDPDYEPDSDDEDDSNYDKDNDLSITMEQFSILAERLDHLYLHDYGLPENCDRILYDGTLYNPQQKFKIPSVIASWDLFQRLPQSTYSSSWPSLFVGKKGSNSKLHIDSGATGFFMYLVSGRKRWVVYNRDERVHLYEKIDDFATYPDVLGIGKDRESDDFLSRRFPLLHRAEAAYEIIQEPGQLVWIPPSCPHAVENLDDIIGFAMNVVPRDGVANHFHDQIHNSLEFAVVDLAMNYWLFEDTAEKPFPTTDPLYTTYGEFKAQF